MCLSKTGTDRDWRLLNDQRRFHTGTAFPMVHWKPSSPSFPQLCFVNFYPYLFEPGSFNIPPILFSTCFDWLAGCLPPYILTAFVDLFTVITMRSKPLLFELLAITTTGVAFARFFVDSPPMTKPYDPMLPIKRAASTSTASIATSTPGPPPILLSEDPWQCVTENVTHYFLDVPRPTGNVEEAINSYGGKLNEACYATATGADILSCTVSDPKQWCGLTTVVPSGVLSSYSTYASAVTSYWKENSASISKLATSCPVTWAKVGPFKHSYLSIASAYANCHLQANPTASTTSSTSSKTTSTPTTKATTTSKGAALARGRALETVVLMSTGLAVLAGAA